MTYQSGSIIGLISWKENVVEVVSAASSTMQVSNRGLKSQEKVNATCGVLMYDP